MIIVIQTTAATRSAMTAPTAPPTTGILDVLSSCVSGGILEVETMEGVAIFADVEKYEKT